MGKIFNNDWFKARIGLFNHFLSQFKNKENIKFLEIGSFEGQSTCWCLDNILTGQNNKITCIDTWADGIEHRDLDMQNVEKTFLSNIAERKNDVEILKGNSRDCLLSIQNRKNYYNFIYVDGGHTLKDAITDAILSFELLAPGGLMAFDDYEWGGEYPYHKRPGGGINCFLMGWSDEIKIIHKQYQVWIRKK